MCKDPCIPKRDVLQEVGTAVATAVSTVGRLVMRIGCRWFSDERLEHGRRILTHRFMWELLAAAALVWWLGRAATFVFAGAAAGSWALSRALKGELYRREQREADRWRNERRARNPRRARPAKPAPAPAEDLDREAEALIAAAKATGEGR